MMQPRKPVRRFTGLVGLPPEPVSEPVRNSTLKGTAINSRSLYRPKHSRPGRPMLLSRCGCDAPVTAPVAAVAEPEPVKRGRGRPPMLGVPMTAAERKASSRANQKAKLDDAERRNLVAEILRIIRRNISRPGPTTGPGRVNTPARAQNIWDKNRRYLNSLHEKLISLPVVKLRETLNTLQSTPDSKGRLHNESSGGRGINEFETIVNARQHRSDDPQLIEDRNPLAVITGNSAGGGNPLLAGRNKAQPPGAGPDADETDSSADVADIRRGEDRPAYDPTTEEKWLSKTISALIEDLGFRIGSRTRCPWCDESFLSEVGMERHLEDKYNEGKRSREKHRKHAAVVEEYNLYSSGPELEVTPWDDSPFVHYRELKILMASLKKMLRKPRKPRIS